MLSCRFLAAARPLGHALALLAGAWLVLAGAPEVSFAATPLTLDEAWRLAEAANPSLRTAQANQAAVEGQRADTRGLLWNNPQLSAETLRREGRQPGFSQERWREWNAGLSQTFEIAGQQGLRREAADQDLAALQAALQETRRHVRADIELRFVRVLALQLRIATEEVALRLVEDAAAAVQKRVAAGEDSRLDGNLALVEAERGRNQLAALREQLTEVRAELASALQLAPESLPEVTGELMPSAANYTLDQLLATALGRPQLQALERREAAAASRLGLERASAYPDITVGVRAGREGATEARERLVGVSLSVPLPLFRRNATGIGKATTELTQAQIERQVAGRDIPAQVRALWLNVESLRARVKRLEANVLASLDQNQLLSAKSYRAGEIGLLQLIVVNRQVLDGRRDLIDARSELRLATVALQAAAGWPAAGESR
ncbi:MAG: cobalt-zinc-cadmium resistance protein CzcC [Rhodocyclaceae bacterium]|nr:MAG: cobalt-zinc-cadmium resistance protein CzcC [Rhodocyclaceae bacterium]